MKKKFLQSYALTYLKVEVWAEQLVGENDVISWCARNANYYHFSTRVPEIETWYYGDQKMH